MAEFTSAIKGLLRREGGYVKEVDDRGGETKFGISKRSYPHLDIESLTRQDAEDIYIDDYWLPLHCDQIIDQRVAAVLFDFGVNAGIRRATKTMQIASGVAVDGIIGPVTLAAMNEASGELLALKFTLRRIEYYVGLATKKASQKKYLAGWISRSLDALN